MTKATSGFTLLEALIAAVLLTLILGILATIWQNVYRSVARSRSILFAHQRARLAMDQAESLLLQRSGAMPLIAQDNGVGPAWPYKLGAWQAKVHVDCSLLNTQNASTREDVNGNGVKDPNDIDLNNDGDIADTLNGRWSDKTANAAWTNDPYSPGGKIVNASVGDSGWNWGMGHRFMWHSSVVRLESNRVFMYTDPATKPTPAWTYFLIENLNGRQSMGGYYTGTTFPWIENHDYWLRPDRRFSPDSKSTIRKPGTYEVDIYGAYRGLSVVPWQHMSGGTPYATPWLGQNYIYRIISGPTYFRDPWSNGQWKVQKTGNHGSSTGVTSGTNVTVNPFDPDWNFIKNWSANATDPALSTADRPQYGDTVTDNGNVKWRCEAPKLMLWDSVGAPQQQGALRSRSMLQGIGNPINERYAAVQLRNSLVIRYNPPDSSGLMQNGQITGASALNGNMLGSVQGSNFSKFVVRTARLTGDWPTPTPVAWQPASANPSRDAARGKWGCTSLPGWWYNSTKSIVKMSPTIQDRFSEGLTAGFPGSSPSGEESPNHPYWTAVDIGVIGGLDGGGRETVSRSFELVFTFAAVLR